MIGSQKHVIILDVDNKDISTGMSSPPEPFVNREFLSKVHAALKPSGEHTEQRISFSQVLINAILKKICFFKPRCSDVCSSWLICELQFGRYLE